MPQPPDKDFWSEEYDKLYAVVLKHYRKVADAGLDSALGIIEGYGVSVDFDLVYDYAKAWAELNTAKVVGEITKTSMDGFLSEFSGWIDSGEPMRDLEKRLAKYYDENRASMIAVTETTRAYAGANNIVYKAAGADTLEWRTALDDYVCSICKKLHGKKADAQGVFPGGYDIPPAHVNCRCMIAPVFSERGERGIPAGWPVSGAITDGSYGANKRLADALNNALSAIDSVHGDGALPSLKVFDIYQGSLCGEYNYADERKLKIIVNLGKSPSHLETTMVHEIGHFLDHQAIGEVGKFGSAESELMSGWRDAVNNSAQVKLLKDIINNTHKYAVEVIGPQGEIERLAINVRYVKYLTEYEELWARSYVQYIATKSGNPLLLEQLKQIRENEYIDEQWSDDDFAPIMEEIDKLFKLLGWII